MVVTASYGTVACYCRLLLSRESLRIYGRSPRGVFWGGGGSGDSVPRQGVLPMMKMAVTIGGSCEINAQIGFQIQERGKEVYRVIHLADFEKSCMLHSDRIDSGHDGDQQRRDYSHSKGQSPEWEMSPYSLFTYFAESSLTRDEFLQKWRGILARAQWSRQGERVEVGE
jgi:hypothetical protein